jgi:hypothetical protein
MHQRFNQFDGGPAILVTKLLVIVVEGWAAGAVIE